MIISIHALLAESDSRTLLKYTGWDYFYPRSPCGERLHCLGGGLLALQFLSTLSLRRATSCTGTATLPEVEFLSTLSLRRATANSGPCNGRLLHFYPRSPCGERPAGNKAGAESFKFLSTLSLRRATFTNFLGGVGQLIISIHALLAESDSRLDAEY